MSLTQDFTVDEARRWDKWQRANARSSHTAELICRVAVTALFLGAFAALAASL